jgi:hypothetical protein
MLHNLPRAMAWQAKRLCPFFQVALFFRIAYGIAAFPIGDPYWTEFLTW